MSDTDSTPVVTDTGFLPPMVMRSTGETTWHAPRNHSHALCGHHIGDACYGFVHPGDIAVADVCAECLTAALQELLTAADEPAAWAVLGPSGNLHMTSRSRALPDAWVDEQGGTVVPLYRRPGTPS